MPSSNAFAATPPVLELPTASSAAFVGAMRYLAAGCSLVATAEGNERLGLTATAVCSVTADPPSLLVCVNRDGRAHAAISRSGTLSVNVLSEAQESLARRFAGMVKDVRGEDRFLEGVWTEGNLGAPLLTGALASFDCRVVETVRASTHTIFICEVMGVEAASDPESGPLIFFNRAFATLDTEAPQQ
ncbi:MAG TPA: flavin reductase family protein [Rhodocyclaceae bacterium]|nr:flavin reductase family protein [Rhodocyclaceae bacterium]